MVGTRACRVLSFRDSCQVSIKPRRPAWVIMVAMRRRPPPEDEEEPRVPLRERLLEVPWEVPREVWLGRLVLLVLMALWGASVWLDRMTEMPRVLHLTVILFHEAGHVIFRLFGETMGVAGGTLGQLLVPLVCVVALVRHGDNFGAALALAWMAMSLIDASVYAYDAADPVLPLLGGGTGADSFHDFIYLFDEFGQLGRARGWARLMKGMGTLLMLAAWGWAARLLVLQREVLR